jgi:hypothetical protein
LGSILWPIGCLENTSPRKNKTFPKCCLRWKNNIFLGDSKTQNIFFTKENSILEKSFIWKDILNVNKLTFLIFEEKNF